MVRVLRRRFDDDDDDYDPKYPGKRVFKDGLGPRVHLMLTDSSPRRFVPVMDARAREHQRVLDSYRLTDAEAARHKPHEARLSDADVRSRSEAREAMIAQARDAWKRPIGGVLSVNEPDDDEDENGDDDGVDPVEKARQDYITRTTNAWREPWRGAGAGPSSADAYAKGNDPGRAANAVEAQRRRWTRESPSDAGDDRARAYAEYCRRISVDWMR
jgi:hypothetical protein